MSRCIVGVMAPGKLQERERAIAKGRYKPGHGEPTVWFHSTSSLAAVLSDDNRAVLRTIRDSKPGSLAELAELTGRRPPNLSRTLKTMASYGLVELRRDKGRLVPVVKATEFLVILD
ncbi:MAG: helix-turn-helix domain-containing protein [Pseudomonadota bacterium]